MMQSMHSVGVMPQPLKINMNATVEVEQILCPKCHKPNVPRAHFCQHCGHDVVLNNDAPSDKRRYRIMRVIKQGGQGAVYEGIDQHNHVYAIKEMLDLATDPRERSEVLQRFNAEAELLQKLSHPRIPRVYSHFTDEGKHYLTMDFVRGEDLDQIIERHTTIPERQALEWADQICDVLEYLHGNGLVYRDVKPSNIMIEHSSGNVKLIDFGIAKVLNPAERGGTQIGTPGYAPPEQYQGLATPASDIYALGATLHHALTGRDPTENPPFSFPPARNVNINISRRTSDSLEKALHMQPEQRFGSIAEFRAMLRPLASQPTQVRVAPAQTAALPQPQVAAASATVSQPAPNPAPPHPVKPSASKPGTTTQPPLTAAPQPRPTPTARSARTKQRRRGGWLAWVSVLVLLAVIGAGAFVYIQYPEAVRQIIPSIEQVLPDNPTAPTSLHTQTFTAENLEIVAAPDADANTIRSQFIDAYTEQAQSQLGTDVIINPNFPPTYVGGEPQRIGEENGLIRYQATVQGHISVP